MSESARSGSRGVRSPEASAVFSNSPRSGQAPAIRYNRDVAGSFGTSGPHAPVEWDQTGSWGASDYDRVPTAAESLVRKRKGGAALVGTPHCRELFSKPLYFSDSRALPFYVLHVLRHVPPLVSKVQVRSPDGLLGREHRPALAFERLLSTCSGPVVHDATNH